MREARLIFPTGGDLSDLMHVAVHTEEAIIQEFGGATVTNGNGFWLDAERKLCAEPIRVIDVAYEQNKANDAKLYDFAWKFMHDGKQKEVYLRYGNGHVQMVTERSCMDNGEFDWEGLMSGIGHDIDANPLEELVP